MSTELEIYTPAKVPALMQDLQAAEKLGLIGVPAPQDRPEPPPWLADAQVVAYEEGERFHPDGLVERYRRTEFAPR